MINPVSGSHASQATQQTQSALPKAQPKSDLPQDTVSLNSSPRTTSEVDQSGDSK
jgi:hypothetical protein